MKTNKYPPESPLGIIEADGWCFGMHGKRWKDIITRLDEVETEDGL